MSILQVIKIYVCKNRVKYSICGYVTDYALSNDIYTVLMKDWS